MIPTIVKNLYTFLTNLLCVEALLINFKIKFIQLYILKYATHAHAALSAPYLAAITSGD